MKSRTYVFYIIAFFLIIYTTKGYSVDDLKYKYEYESLTQYDRVNSKTPNNDNWDPVSGTISFSATDIDIPGNNSLKVQLRRILEPGGGKTHKGLGGFGGKNLASTSQWEVEDILITKLWSLDLPHIRATTLTGKGVKNTGENSWVAKMECRGHTPPTLYDTNTGNPGGQGIPVYGHQHWGGATLHIPGETTEAFLEADTNHPAYAGNDPWGRGKIRVTKSNWKYDSTGCIPANGHQGFYVYAPDGRRFSFTEVKEYMVEERPGIKMNALQVRRVFLPSRVEDKFGNYVNYIWNDGYLTSIESSDNRRITLHYNTNGDGIKYLYQAKAHGKTWTYTGDGYGKLTNVKLPNGKLWQYEYNDSYASMFVSSGSSPLPSQIPSNYDRNAPPGICSFTGASTRGDKSFKIIDPEGLKTEYRMGAAYMGRYQAHTGIQGTIAPTWNVKLTNLNCHYSLALYTKVITGPGLPAESSNDAMKWEFYYSENKGTYSPAVYVDNFSTNFLKQIIDDHDSKIGNEKYVDWQSSFPSSVVELGSDYRAKIRTSTVIGPKSKAIHYVNRDEKSAFDGKVVAVDTLDLSGNLLKRLENYFTKGNKVGDQMISNKGYDAVLKAVNITQMENQSNNTKTVIRTYESNGNSVYTTKRSFSDFFGKPTIVEEYNDIHSQKKFTKQSYVHYIQPGYWQIGLPGTTSLSSNGSSYSTVARNTYKQHSGFNSRKSYVPSYQFVGPNSGDWVKRFSSYHSDGLVKVIEFNQKLVSSSGSQTSNYRYQKFEQYKRGIPQKVSLPNRYSHLNSDEISLSSTVDDFGMITKHIDLDGMVSNYFYDEIGRIKSVTYDDPDIADILYRWSTSQGRPVRYQYFCSNVSGTNCQGNTKSIMTVYNALLNPVYVKTSALNAGPSLRYVNYEYDALGNVTFQSFPSATSSSSNGIRKTYDALSRLKSEYHYGAGTKTFEYLDQNTTLYRDGEGNVTKTSYFSFGTPQRDKIRKIDSEENVLTEIEYDIFENQTLITQSGEGQSLTQYNAYDSYRRLCKVSRSDTGVSVYSQNILGELKWKADGTSHGSGSASNCTNSTSNSIKVNLTYDNLGATWKVAHGSRAADGLTNEYSNNGNLKKAITGDNVVRTYSYTGKSWLSKEIIDFDNKQWVLDYEYDKQGGVKSITYPSRNKVEYNPNGLGQPTEIKRDGLYYATNIVFNVNGRLDSFNYGNGLAHKTYFGANNLPSQIKDWSTNTTALHQSVGYNNNFSIDKVTDHQNASYSISNIVYDGLDRVEKVYGGSSLGNSSITYDVFGNIKTYSSKYRNLIYSYTGNKLSQVNDTYNNKDYSIFQYDSRGNVLFNGKRSFTYNLNNQIISSGSNSYVYDGHNRRIKTIDSKGTTYTIYSQSGKLLHKEINNKGIDYIYLGKKLIAKDGEKGSISGHGRKHSRPFGEQIEMAENDIGYTGHLYDQDLGLNYMQARYYDPVIGRFYSNDPVDATAFIMRGNVQGFNRYAYANNNPYKYVDPDGRSPSAYIVMATPADQQQAVVNTVSKVVEASSIKVGVGTPGLKANLKSPSSNFKVDAGLGLTGDVKVDDKGLSLNVEVEAAAEATDSSGHHTIKAQLFKVAGNLNQGKVEEKIDGPNFEYTDSSGDSTKSIQHDGVGKIGFKFGVFTFQAETDTKKLFEE